MTQLRPTILLTIMAMQLATLHAGAFAFNPNKLLEQSQSGERIAGAALSVSIDGNVIYSQAAGCAQFHKNPDRGCKVSLQPETKFRVASISKMALALAVHRLVDTGKLKLDADISGYLGWTLRNPAFPSAHITVRHLLEHTSSIRDPEPYWVEAPGTLRSLFTEGATPFAAKDASLDLSPGSYFSYANLNSAILATILENVQQERFDRLMSQIVFIPRNLDAGYNWSGVSRKARRKGATLFRYGADGWEAQTDDQKILRSSLPYFLAKESVNKKAYLRDYTPGQNASLFSPQGGLRASVLDLLRLTRAMAYTGAMQKMTWQVNDNASNGDTQDGYFSAYGLGAHTITGTDDAFPGYAFRGHSGEAYGLYSGAWDVITMPGTPADIHPDIQVSFAITGTQGRPAAGSHPSFNQAEEMLMRTALEEIKKYQAAPPPTSAHHGHGADDPRPYDQTRNAKNDVETTLANAAQSGRKPLLVLGANWCHDSRGLAARFLKPEFQSLINEHYELLYVDVGRRERNLDIAARFGVDKLVGTPTVFILDSDLNTVNADSVHMWRRAASISDEETFEYLDTFARGEIWSAEDKSDE